MMRKKITSLTSFSFLIVISSFFMISCGDSGSLVQFDVTYNLPRVYFNYPSTSPIRSDELILYTGEAKINLDSILSVNKIPEGLIKSAYFSRFAMTITNPPEADFNWLQSAKVLVSKNSSIDPNAELAYIDTINPGSKILNMKVNDVNLISYMNDTTFYYQLRGTPSGVLPYPMVSMYIDLQVKLHIEAF